MRHAYAWLGVSFLLVFGGAYLLFERAHAPTNELNTIINQAKDDTSTPPMAPFTLTSTAFKDGEKIPRQFTCDGENVSPPLALSGIPEGTQSLVLVMYDPDIPQAIKEARGIEKFDHWVMYDLAPDTTEIPQGAMIGVQAPNGAGESAYTGPCPPPDLEPTEHRYVFEAYALSGILNFVMAPTLDQVVTAAEGMLLGKATLTGRYQRAK